MKYLPAIARPMLAGLLIFFLLGATALRAETAPEEAIAAAQDGLQAMLARIPVQDMDRYGFLPGDSLKEAHLGAPCQLYLITEKALKGYSEGDSLNSLTSPTGSWLFPVLIENRPTCILTLGKVKGAWTPVGIGRSQLASEMGTLATQWPRTKGEAPQLIAVIPAKSYFFSVPNQEMANLTPLNFAAKPASAPDYDKLAGLKETLSKLKEKASPGSNRANGEGK